MTVTHCWNSRCCRIWSSVIVEDSGGKCWKMVLRRSNWRLKHNQGDKMKIGKKKMRMGFGTKVMIGEEPDAYAIRMTLGLIKC